MCIDTPDGRVQQSTEKQTILYDTWSIFIWRCVVFVLFYIRTFLFASFIYLKFCRRRRHRRLLLLLLFLRFFCCSLTLEIFHPTFIVSFHSIRIKCCMTIDKKFGNFSTEKNSFNLSCRRVSISLSMRLGMCVLFWCNFECIMNKQFYARNEKKLSNVHASQANARLNRNICFRWKR